jgi:predicted O-methyltransferase YrrM
MTAVEHLKEWWGRSEQCAPARLPKLTRARLAQLFGEWGLRDGAEIGVDSGRFSEVLFAGIPGLCLIGVDPWERNPLKEEQARSRLAKQSGWSPFKATSLEAAREIADGSLDFVYIDGDHRFDFVMLDLILWAPKVRVGGVIAGHDYYRFRNAGVVPAVDAYTQAHRVHEWFLTDEKEASFFWVKEN